MKKLLITDFNKIEKYLKDADYEGYNSNFVNMMLWDHEYNIYYHLDDHFLVMLHTYGKDRFFSMPFCKDEYIKEAIDYMIDYAHHHYFPFKINLAVNKVKKNMEKIYQDRFLYLEDRNNFDYIYSRDALVHLKGKKMQKRRNHLNAFYKNHQNYIYKEIEDEDIDQVLKCLKQWDKNKEDGDSIRSEYLAIMYALIHRKTLNIKTGCIYIDNKLEAFIIGSALLHQTVEIHFEKANKNIRGLYVLICKLFLENNFIDYQYVNREEDMGIEMLRKSKLSLHPDHMIEKYTIIEKNLTIRQATHQDISFVKKQWLNNFDDEDMYSTEYYFDHLYNLENNYIVCQNQNRIGNMQIRPFEIINNNEKETVYFILGVVIDKKYRQNGCMRYLLENVFQTYFKDKKLMLQAYAPSIYHHFGFVDTYMNHHYVVSDHLKNKREYMIEDQFCDDAQVLCNLYSQFTKKFNGYLCRNQDYYQDYMLKRNKAIHRKLRLIYVDHEIGGYIEYEESNQTMLITECIILNTDHLYSIINYYLNHFKKIELFLPESWQVDLPIDHSYCNMLTNFDFDSQKKLFINEIY